MALFGPKHALSLESATNLQIDDLDEGINRRSPAHSKLVDFVPNRPPSTISGAQKRIRPKRVYIVGYTLSVSNLCCPSATKQ